MDKPLCRVCGARHWGNDHVFENSEEDVELCQPGVVGRGDEMVEASGKQGISEGSKETGQVARNRRWREKNRERYNAYMREYRKRDT